jgi:hypothetical protein
VLYLEHNKEKIKNIINRSDKKGEGEKLRDDD